jgi:Putative beta-barrel porin 2
MDRFASPLRLDLCAALAFASLLGGAAGMARAEADPYYLGISQSLGHNSNVYRVGDQEIPDKFATTSINAGFDQPIGRQRVFASASVRATRYEDIRILDNTGYGLNAGWDLSTIGRVSGGIGIAVNRSLANYAPAGDQQQVPQTKLNEETSSLANVRVQVGLVSLLAFNVSASHSEIKYSAVEYDRSEMRQTAASLGLTYRPSGLLTLGGALRATRGEYPNVVVVSTGANDRFDREDLDLTANWAATGLSNLSARLSYGRSEFDGQTQRNTKGATGSLGWDWKPTGKLAFNTTLSRDTGTETALFALANNAGTAVGDNSTLTNAFGLGVGYEASAKIRLTLGTRYARRELVSGTLTGRDSVTTVSFGASYAPTRSWQLGCNASQEDRKPSDGTGTVSSRYSATQASCNAQFTIR